jgi:LysM repeat protein
MTLLAALRRGLILLGCCALGGGCFLDSDGPVDEKKEPHFVAGRGRVNSMDYRGAIESFEKALEVNPRSASAHFELGWLLEEKEKDYAGAIYHYERFLKLRPKDEKLDQLRQRIINCKQDLVRTVSIGPLDPKLKAELDRLNKQVDSLTAQLAQATQRLVPPAKTNTVAETVVPPAPIPVPAPAPTGTNRLASAQKNLANASGGTLTSAVPVTPVSPTAKTHTIKSGDTPAALARKYGISLNALMAANPSLDPKKLRIGQVINVPAK